MTTAPIRLQDLQRRIYAKAKAEPSWRFWGLYVHVCKLETLRTAYAAAKANNGAPGIDGVTFDTIEASGVEEFLQQLRDALLSRTYRPLRCRRQAIPKENGRKVRILSIPAIRDRVVQGALKCLLEPIFEADFQPGSFGYRPKRSAHQAVDRVAEAIVQGKTRVVDLDLRSYFDSVRHDLLLAKVARRVNDADVLALLTQMLKASGQAGVPQGGVMTPHTQKVIRMRLRRERPGAGRWQAIRAGIGRADGDRMPQRDRVAVDQHLFHDEPQDLLPLVHVQGLGPYPQIGAEPAERLGQLEVARVVHRGQLQGVELRRNGARLFLEFRHPLAELLQGRQPVLVRAEEPFTTLVQTGLLALQLRGAGPEGIRAPGGQAPARDLGVDQRRVVQQPEDFGPDEGIERILPDGTMGADGAFEMAVAVRAQAAVVV
jgi:RNA-directed DNA polymerase